MSESDLPFAELSQHSPPRRLKYCKPPPAFLHTIIEEDEDHHDPGGAPVSIYEDLRNYEIEDGFYDQGRSPPFNQSYALTDLFKDWIDENSSDEIDSLEDYIVGASESTAAGEYQSSTPRPLPEIPRPSHETPRPLPEIPRPLPAIPRPLPETPRPLPEIPHPLPPTPPLPAANMDSKVPKPGPAKLGPNASLEEWLEEAKQCHYLPENVMKQLCEIVKACLMEGT